MGIATITNSQGDPIFLPDMTMHVMIGRLGKDRGQAFVRMCETFNTANRSGLFAADDLALVAKFIDRMLAYTVSVCERSMEESGD